jgi:1-deoxy-D-xylulose-5-phosphate reductoisomerase
VTVSRHSEERPVRRRVVILGSTGSIGRQGIEVCAASSGLAIVGLVAGRSADAVLEQAAQVGASMVGLHDVRAAADAHGRSPCRVYAGDAGVAELIASAAADAVAAGAELVVLNGIVGAAGLRASMATLESGATLALANKESMVAGGPFVLRAARDGDGKARAAGAAVIPVDSEHSAVFQCLEGGRGGAGRLGVETAMNPLLAAEEILLTGSGGPFRGATRDELAGVTPERALKHPNWVMGPKVTIDSATLMNKGLELIEAHYLFGVPYEQIRVVVHPQSIVHSLVRYADGAVLAHLGVPDMRTPIGYALTYPARAGLPMVAPLDLGARELTFEQPDLEVFGCLRLARQAGESAARAWAGAKTGRSGAAAPVALNAANEIAVAAFLEGRIGFLDIERLVERTLDSLSGEPVASLDEVFLIDAEARRLATAALTSG